MADFPASRLEMSHPPFINIGTDFFGPYLTTMKRSTVKRWCCVFTCFVTRAVHIEITHSMDTSSYIMALHRFISRRGTPAVIYSDNGTNFVGGEREMREVVENWNLNKVADAMSNKGIKWRFNPQGAPHFGGVWERMVRACKRALKHCETVPSTTKPS